MSNAETLAELEARRGNLRLSLTHLNRMIHRGKNTDTPERLAELRATKEAVKKNLGLVNRSIGYRTMHLRRTYVCRECGTPQLARNLRGVRGRTVCRQCASSIDRGTP
jgi:formylmethanofuran dehydrogenase subunit E